MNGNLSVSQNLLSLSLSLSLTHTHTWNILTHKHTLICTHMQSQHQNVINLCYTQNSHSLSLSLSLSHPYNLDTHTHRYTHTLIFIHGQSQHVDVLNQKCQHGKQSHYITFVSNFIHFACLISYISHA